jgi:hypothetical protein
MGFNLNQWMKRKSILKQQIYVNYELCLNKRLKRYDSTSHLASEDVLLLLNVTLQTLLSCSSCKYILDCSR